MSDNDTIPIVTPLPEHGEAERAQAALTVSDPPPAAEPAEAASAEAPAEPEASTSPPPDSEARDEEAESPETRRERLIDELTNAHDDEATTAKPQPSDETASAAQPPAHEPKAETPADDEDLQEVTNESVRAMKPGEARRKINKLISRVKEAEQMAAGYREIVELCQANGLSPEDYKAWVKIGIGLQRGDPTAIEAFKFIGQRVGAALPAAGPDLSAINKLIDELVDSVDMSEEAAKKIRDALGASATPATPAKPAPAQAPVQPPAPPPAQPPAPSATPDAETHRVHRALRELETVAQRYRQRLGDARWKEIQPALVEAMKPRASTPPEAWAAVYEAEIEKLLARGAAKPVASSLRPSSTSGAVKPQFKSERERVIHKLLNED